MQEWRNPIANALELSIFALTHRCDLSIFDHKSLSLCGYYPVNHWLYIFRSRKSLTMMLIYFARELAMSRIFTLEILLMFVTHFGTFCKKRRLISCSVFEMFTNQLKI